MTAPTHPFPGAAGSPAFKKKTFDFRCQAGEMAAEPITHSLNFYFAVHWLLWPKTFHSPALAGAQNSDNWLTCGKASEIKTFQM